MVEQRPVLLTILGDSSAAVCEDDFCVIPGAGASVESVATPGVDAEADAVSPSR